MPLILENLKTTSGSEFADPCDAEGVDFPFCTVYDAREWAEVLGIIRTDLYNMAYAAMGIESEVPSQQAADLEAMKAEGEFDLHENVEYWRKVQAWGQSFDWRLADPAHVDDSGHDPKGRILEGAYTWIRPQKEAITRAVPLWDEGEEILGEEQELAGSEDPGMDLLEKALWVGGTLGVVYLAIQAADVFMRGSTKRQSPF